LINTSKDSYGFYIHVNERKQFSTTTIAEKRARKKVKALKLSVTVLLVVVRVGSSKFTSEAN